MGGFDDSSIDSEYAAAVAAAAFAVSSLQSNNRNQPQAETGSTTTKSKRWDAAPVLVEHIDGNKSKRYSEEALGKNSNMEAASHFARTDVNEISSEKPISLTTSLRKALTFFDKQLDETAGVEPKSMEPQSVLPMPIKLPPVPLPVKPNPEFPQGAQALGVQESKVDAWEKAEMAKIKQWFDKLSATIVEWEDKKKEKAKRRLKNLQRELERRRANAVQYYLLDMERINQIAQGAKAQANENQRNEELKVKEKANKYRTAGELPRRCLCF
ncbi:hypothetical protein Droror1_Dr00008232 [Drosera rotundifolia]